MTNHTTMMARRNKLSVGMNTLNRSWEVVVFLLIMPFSKVDQVEDINGVAT